VRLQRRKPLGAKAPFPRVVPPALAAQIDRVPRYKRWVHEINFDFFQMLLKPPLGDLPNEVFVVLGSSDEEPFDLVIGCVRTLFREALPQIPGGSVVNYDHALLFASAVDAVTCAIAVRHTAAAFLTSSLPSLFAIQDVCDKSVCETHRSHERDHLRLRSN
jgi:hypothetical protein